ncbi:C40 family peptidase [Pedobacter hartonius]|uniref:Lipoprotein Spr/probable lipoprotein NlpC n=1 Tax=Pedobacter hartonius TaxID=425514 RepID=A0A1H4H0S0_9SPHI|nr:NlpC/P60 family protein [Pedobacter hartonius]SEB15346.1 lipoprotein Spr/probable lipoprotein NlpC [Pedobacter hartonius]
MNTLSLRRHSSLQFMIVMAVLVFLSSCGSKRPGAYSSTKAAKAAEAMAELKSKALYRFITDWTGVKYKLGGMDKRGIDCSGFALLLNKEIYGQDIPRRSRDQADVIREKNPDQLKEGDLVFFSFGGKEIDHVGVYLNHGFFVHASTTRGVIVDDMNLPAYQHVLIKGGPVKN